MQNAHSKFIWLLIIGFLFIPIGLYPLFDLDEGNFTQATREMLQRSDWMTPYLHGLIRTDKPIFIHWLQILSTKIWGFNEFGFRFPSAFAGLLWLYTIYRFVKQRLGEQVSIDAVLFALGSLLFTVVTKAATADAVLNLFLCISLMSIWQYFEYKNQSSLLMCFAAIGLGFLTKGPVAIVVPLVVSFVYFVCHGHARFWLKSICNFRGWLIMLSLGLPWYIYQYYVNGTEFLSGFIIHHNIERFSRPFEGHSGNISYYIIVLIFSTLPLTRLVLPLFQWSKICSNKPLERFLWIWFLSVFFIFTVAQTKLPHYLLYGMTPIFILSAIHLKPVNRSWITGPLLLVMGLFLIIPSLIKWLNIENARVSIIEIGFWYSTITFCLGFLSCVCLMYLKNMRYFLWSQMIIMMFFIMMVVVPFFSSLEQLPIKHAAEYAKDLNLDVISYRMISKPSFWVYRESLMKNDAPNPGQIIFTYKHHLINFPSYNILFEENNIVLAKLGESI